MEPASPSSGEAAADVSFDGGPVEVNSAELFGKGDKQDDRAAQEECGLDKTAEGPARKKPPR